jgi:signal transduction histidine kinase/ActR/RegA family two-component response regulator
MTDKPRNSRLAFRSIRLAAIAGLCALVPLFLLAVLISERAVEVVEDEVTARLRLTTALSSELLAEQLSPMLALMEAGANRPRLIEAVADGNPANFDNIEIERQLTALQASHDGFVASGLLDLNGVLLGSPVAPELVGNSYADRDYYQGLIRTGQTYASEAFQSAQAGNPFILTIATYVRSTTDGQLTGQPLAILVGGVNLNHVQTFVDEVAAVQGVDLWVSDQRGTVLAAPGGQQTSQLVAIADLPVGNTPNSASNELVAVDVDGVQMLTVQQSVGALGWTVIAGIPTSDAVAGSNQIRDTVGAVGLPLLLVAAAGIFLLVRYQRLRWRAEDVAHAAQDEARTASLMKSEFLSRMSHELRTPLNSVLGFAQLLDLDELNDNAREAVSHILRAGRHLLDLINEVLDISRIEAGQLALSIEPVLVRETVKEALDLIRPMAAQRDIGLADPPGGLSNIYVLADRQRLKQILINLLSNAVKYNSPGGTVTVACEPLGLARLKISVTDTGRGLDPGRLNRLFVPFERLGAERTEIEGTGIGLALSDRLAKAMNGRLGVTSTIDVGSTFWVELSTAEGPLERHERLNGDSAKPTSEAAATLRHNVLYIEDNLANLTLVERVVAHRGDIQLIACMQGSLGVDFAVEHRPELIFLDLHLPDLSGETVFEHLQSNPLTATTPVIVVSADATPGRIQRLIAAGAAGYLTKPINVQELLRTLDDFLAEAGTHTADPAPVS